jgi:NADPH-dependent 2,4-dienoyl-CoA reductase/sulfur reductase-like enzyme
LLAALIASRSGARVMIVDDNTHPGGYLRKSQTQINGRASSGLGRGCQCGT